MKALYLALAISAAVASAHAADVYPPRVAPGMAAPQRIPLALRTLSRRSASVLASDACWRGCTAQCGWHFQHCLRVSWLDGCIALNNECDLTCLKACRLHGGPLVSWTDY